MNGFSSQIPTTLCDWCSRNSEHPSDCKYCTFVSQNLCREHDKLWTGGEQLECLFIFFKCHPSLHTIKTFYEIYHLNIPNSDLAQVVEA